MVITGRPSPTAAHIPDGCDGVARSGGQPGGGEAEHGIISTKYQSFQSQYFPPGESGRKLCQFDTRRTWSDAEYERRSRQVCLFSPFHLFQSQLILASSREKLVSAETEGVLCRDDSVEGLR